MKKPEDAAELIKRYEEILRTKRKGIISSISSGKNCLVGFTKKKSLKGWVLILECIRGQQYLKSTFLSYWISTLKDLPSH